jgi:Reverse transcriptase (RNA-dependent DNA polymerase)
MPHGRKLVGNRWVYTEKYDGTYRSRTVAQGFSQVPGKDFTDSHAPVMTDLAFRLALIITVLKKLRTRQFDTETAFLYSELDEEIYMRLPGGYVKYMLEVHNIKIDPSTRILLLKKAIYGLVQASRQWWKKFKEVMATCVTTTRVNQILFSLSRKRLMENQFLLLPYMLMLEESLEHQMLSRK